MGFINELNSLLRYKLLYARKTSPLIETIMKNGLIAFNIIMVFVNGLKYSGISYYSWACDNYFLIVWQYT